MCNGRLPTDYQKRNYNWDLWGVSPGHEKDYNNWVTRYLTLERKAPGYLGYTMIVPGGSKLPLRYIIPHLADKLKWRDGITQKNH